MSGPNVIKLSWWTVTSGAPHCSFLGLVLFDILINALDEEIECILSKSAEDTNLSDGVDAFEDGKVL